MRLARPALAAGAEAVVVVALQAPVAAALELRALQFLRFPAQVRPPQGLNLLPAEEVGLPVKVPRVVRQAVAVEAAAVVEAVAVAVLPQVVLLLQRFQARRSSPCCWLPAWM